MKCKAYGVEVKDDVCQDPKPNALICASCGFNRSNRPQAEPAEEETPVENSEVETETDDEQVEVEVVEAEQEHTAEETAGPDEVVAGAEE